MKPPVWIDRPEALSRAAAVLSTYPILAVDTESNSLYVYREQVCLIQFSTPDEDYLVDPLAIKDLSPLAPIFADPHLEKIFHAAEYDLICLKRDFGFQFANLFDTMMAGRILGRSAVGLSHMIEAEFGLVLDKRYQRANWGIRPLPAAQLTYARTDTHYLIPLRDRLKAELIETGRWELAREDFQRICYVNGNGRTSDDWQDACWRVSGAQELPPQQLAVLQQLCQMRDLLAREMNRPPFKVLSNQTLLDIAQHCPQTLAELGEVPGVTERQVQRFGSEILHAVQRGLVTLPVARPSMPRSDEKFILRLEALRAWRKQTAQQVGVESDVILPRDVMFAIAEANPQTHSELSVAMQRLPWRMQRFGDDILKIIH